MDDSVYIYSYEFFGSHRQYIIILYSLVYLPKSVVNQMKCIFVKIRQIGTLPNCTNALNLVLRGNPQHFLPLSFILTGRFGSFP